MAGRDPTSYDNDRDRVRDRADIVRIVGEHLKLIPKGREFVGLCPFHDDHSPSMSVVPAKQIFHCFSCGAGGDVFTFVQKYHRMEFREALEYLAERVGIELTRSRPEPGGPSAGPTRRDIVAANAFALAFFRKCLQHEAAGKLARDAIAARGVAPEMVEAFMLGAAPDSWEGLATAAQKKGITPAALVAAGLAKPRSGGGGHFDMFRKRLIFPITDQAGRPIAFGARKLDPEDEPKYLNSPESPVFNKSATLYGLAQAARTIQKTGRAIITEGYTDTIACHQAGFTNAVATLGTAFTTEHARLLRRLCDTVVLVFDADEAGQRAADRATEVLFAVDLDVKVALPPEGGLAKDPDELLKQPGGPEAFAASLDGAIDLLAFRYQRLGARLKEAGPAAVQRAVEDELSTLADLGLTKASPIRRQLVLRTLAGVTGLTPGLLAQLLPAAGTRRAGSSIEAENEPGSQQSAFDPRRAAQESGEWGYLLGCALAQDGLAQTLFEETAGMFDTTANPTGGRAPQSATPENRLAAPSAGAAAYGSTVLARVAMAARSAATDPAQQSDRALLQAVLDTLREDEDARALALELERRAASGFTDQQVRVSFEDSLRDLKRRTFLDSADRSLASAAERIKLRQDIHRRFGPNPRSLPRPAGDQ